MNILKVRGKDGTWVDIDAIKGDAGKSAYDQAVEGGFTGTEEEFIQILNGILAPVAPIIVDDEVVTKESIGLGNVDNTSDMDKPVSTLMQNALSAVASQAASQLSAHTTASNPHGITADGLGAIKKAYSASSDLDTELTAGGNKMTVCSYSSTTKNTPKTEGITTYAHGMVITNSYASGSDKYGYQICMPSGDNNLFVRSLSKGTKTAWTKVYSGTNKPTASDVGVTVPYKGTYTGTGTTGQDNPCSITFTAPPKFVAIMDHMASYIGFFIKGNNQYVVISSNGIMSSGANVTWSGNKLTWYMANSSQYYQLNGGTWTYHYVAVF